MQVKIMRFIYLNYKTEYKSTILLTFCLISLFSHLFFFCAGMGFHITLFFLFLQQTLMLLDSFCLHFELSISSSCSCLTVTKGLSDHSR